MAYDFGVLVSKLKDKGLDVAEDAAVIIYDVVTEWVMESAQASENKMDDMLLAVLPVINGYVKAELLDKIDGQDDIEQ